MGPQRGKDIRDAVHGDIEFDRFELDVINTPEFQRMRGIRQLGLAHLVYPSAHHTRFEHSLGVVFMASRIVDAVRRNSGREAVSESNHRFLRALALVHDIGHIPFGHTLEDERPVFDEQEHHDEEARLSLFLRNTELEKAIKALGRDAGFEDLPGRLIRFMKHTHEGTSADKLSAEEQLLANIIGNTICADLLDYLKRDPFFTGIHHTYDEKLISAFEVGESKIFINLQDGSRVRHGLLSEILHLLRLRYTLGERVYYHQTKAAASAMISKAVALSGLPHAVLARLRDEELLYVLENCSPKEKVFGVAIKNPERVRTLVKSIRERKLFRPVYSITRAAAKSEHKLDELVKSFYDAGNRQTRADVEEEIAKAAGLDPHQVIIYCPDKKMSTKAAMVEVLWPKEVEPKPLQTLCEQRQGIEDENTIAEIQQLKNKHEALWQLTVFVGADCPPEIQKNVAAYCAASGRFYHIPDPGSGLAPSAEEILFNRQFVQAVASSPEGSQIDSTAARELATADFHGGRGAMSVDGIREAILKPDGDISGPAAGQAAGKQSDLFGPMSEAGRPGADGNNGKPS